MVAIKGQLLILLFFCLSCSRVQYLFEQSIGQISLLTTARDNYQVLKDPRIAAKDKQKIKRIQEYKKYFYQFFQEKETAIYTKTTLLKRDAVSHLVIASPHNQVKAYEECFPLVGCFPYLGFFHLSSAKRYAEYFQDQGFITWIRPVYAYSTLGYFNDTILSSFFFFDEYDLAELIFHELFHTLFFAKDEVDLNENLANYFAVEMVKTYPNFDPHLQSRKEIDRKNDDAINRLIVNLINQLNEIYRKHGLINHTEARKIFDDFLNNKFLVELKEKCIHLGIDLEKCEVLKEEWNNASLAAILTYQKDIEKIRKLHHRLGISLRKFYLYLKRKYKQYNQSKIKISFSDFLFKK